MPLGAVSAPEESDAIILTDPEMMAVRQANLGAELGELHRYVKRERDHLEECAAIEAEQRLLSEMRLVKMETMFEKRMADLQMRQTEMENRYEKLLADLEVQLGRVERKTAERVPVFSEKNGGLWIWGTADAAPSKWYNTPWSQVPVDFQAGPAAFLAGVAAHTTQGTDGFEQRADVDELGQTAQHLHAKPDSPMR